VVTSNGTTHSDSGSIAPETAKLLAVFRHLQRATSAWQERLGDAIVNGSAGWHRLNIQLDGNGLPVKIQSSTGEDSDVRLDTSDMTR